MYELKDREYNYISSKVYDYARINLTERKRPLIIARLAKRIRFLELKGFPEYVDYLKNSDISGSEFQIMVDTLSTNYSHFFREPHHLDFLTTHILPEAENKELRIWSAASSSGQEIYSILITIKEYQRKTKKRIRYKLFASDISRKVLISAATGIYSKEDAKKIEDRVFKEYFLKGTGNNADKIKVKNRLIQEVKFFRLNLSDKKYNLPLMDVIFLRNAIIYFDHQTKTELIDRLHSYLNPGGYLIIGHSESLSSISDKFTLVGKTIYKRKD